MLLHGGHCTDALLQTVTALDAHSLEVVFTEDAPEARVAHAGVCVGGSSLMMFGCMSSMKQRISVSTRSASRGEPSLVFCETAFTVPGVERVRA